VARNLPERFLSRYRFLKRSLPPSWRGRLSLLAKTPEEFEAAAPPLYLDIACDGKILYDPLLRSLALTFTCRRTMAMSRLATLERFG
jgi:hypothetical protein